MLSFEAFRDLFIQYIQQENPTSEAAEDAKQKLEDCIPFHWIMCKWNGFEHDYIDSLSNELAGAVWTPDHCLIHRLYEIGHYEMLTIVFHHYLRLCLASKSSLQSLSLQRFVRYYLENFHRITAIVSHLRFTYVQQSERDRVQQLANCCTCPQLQQMVVVFAALVADWSLVSHTLRVRSFPLEYICNLLIWLMCICSVPEKIRKQLLQVIKSKGQRTESLVPRHLHRGRRQTASLGGYMFIFDGLPAVDTHNWPLIRRVFLHCSDKSVLSSMCTRSAIHGELDIPVRILRSLAQKPTHPAVLYYFIIEILRSVRDQQTVVTLLVVCAMLGVSTHCRFGPSGFPIEKFSTNPVSVLKAALTSGMVSYTDFLQYVQESCSNADNSQQFVEEMQAECPRPLWELCRLTTSHRIGYRSGRQQRINALTIPEPMKWLVSFYDLDIPCEQAGL